MVKEKGTGVSAVCAPVNAAESVIRQGVELVIMDVRQLKGARSGSAAHDFGAYLEAWPFEYI